MTRSSTALLTKHASGIAACAAQGAVARQETRQMRAYTAAGREAEQAEHQINLASNALVVKEQVWVRKKSTRREKQRTPGCPKLSHRCSMVGQDGPCAPDASRRNGQFARAGYISQAWYTNPASVSRRRAPHTCRSGGCPARAQAAPAWRNAPCAMQRGRAGAPGCPDTLCMRALLPWIHALPTRRHAWPAAPDAVARMDGSSIWPATHHADAVKGGVELCKGGVGWNRQQRLLRLLPRRRALLQLLVQVEQAYRLDRVPAGRGGDVCRVRGVL